MDNIPQIEDLFEEKDLKELERLLTTFLIQNIEINTDRIGGKLSFTESTETIVKSSLKSFYNSKQYQKSIAKYLINIDKISLSKLENYEKDNLKISKSAITPSQRLAINEYLGYLTENGLNAKFNQPLRQLIYSNIQSGTSQTELENKLKKYVEGGKDESGKLKSYIKQVAIQGADAYTSIIDQKITDKYIDKVTGFIMTGSLIDSSSPQCKYCVKELDRLIKKEDWNKVKKIAQENGLIENTEFKDLPTNKLHWGCRHTFTPKLT